jgi:hypothetical protein
MALMNTINQVVEQRINTLVDAAGNAPVSPVRLRTMLEQVAQEALHQESEELTELIHLLVR